MMGTIVFVASLACFLSVPVHAAGGETSARETRMPRVDLERYMGRWYEIARLPMWFQRGCVESWATYTLAGTETVRVVNECITAQGGRKSAEGTATVVDKTTNSRLEVVFDNWFSRLLPFLARGKYWIFHIDPDYQHAIVGHPNRKYLWILSRSPRIEEETYLHLVSIARELGFDTSRLVRSK